MNNNPTGINQYTRSSGSLRRAGQNPRASQGDPLYASVRKMNRGSIATALKWGRNASRKGYAGPSNPGSMPRSFMTAFEDGKAQARRKT